MKIPELYVSCTSEKKLLNFRDLFSVVNSWLNIHKRERAQNPWHKTIKFAKLIRAIATTNCIHALWIILLLAWVRSAASYPSLTSLYVFLSPFVTLSLSLVLLFSRFLSLLRSSLLSLRWNAIDSMHIWQQGSSRPASHTGWFSFIGGSKREWKSERFY